MLHLPEFTLWHFAYWRLFSCDVNNPLYRENGAACIYGSQKGATTEMVDVLDSNLRYFS